MSGRENKKIKQVNTEAAIGYMKLHHSLSVRQKQESQIHQKEQADESTEQQIFGMRSVPVGLSGPPAAVSPPPPAVDAVGALAVMLVYFLLPLYSVLLSSSRAVVAPDWMPESEA